MSLVADLVGLNYVPVELASAASLERELRQVGPLEWVRNLNKPSLALQEPEYSGALASA